MYGMPGACSVTSLLASAHACARSAGSTVSFALSMASLTSGTLSCDQLLLPTCRMFAPLKIGSIIVCGSEKSCSQPTLGQTLTFCFGLPQNFVNMVLRSTSRSFVLKPISLSCCSVICETDLSGSAPSPTISTVASPSYLPEDMPAFLKYSADRLRSPSGFAIQSSSEVQPWRPLDSSKPAMPGGM